MKLIIYGAPRTKKNSAQLIGGMRPRLIPSKAYREYERDAISQLPMMQPIESPVNVQCVYYMPTRRRVDLVNLLEATCDILVHGKVLADDNCGIVVGHDGSRVLYDKENPRVEIEITEVHDATYPGDADPNPPERLLERMEPVAPKVLVDTWVCGNCGARLERQCLIGPDVLMSENFNYCPACGKKVKWDAYQRIGT